MTMTEPPAPDIVLARNIPWADELAKRAVAMWKAGSSSRVIGIEIGKSRNAVMGKLNRMGLRRHVQPKTSPHYHGDQAQPARRYAQKKREPWSGVEIKPEVTPTAVGIVDLERHHCRWPASGEGAAMMYCGGNAVNGLSYCARHCRMAYYQRAAGRPYEQSLDATLRRRLFG